MKKRKNMVALVLIFLMLFPSLSTVALELNNIKKDNVINSEETLENKLIEENIDNNLENTIEDVKIIKEEIKDSEVNLQNEDIKDSEVNLQNEEENNLKSVDNPNIQTEDNYDSLVGEFYKEIKKPLINSYKSNNVYEREEFNLKAKSIEETILEKKTNGNYEVALAHSDGTYSYVDSSESMEQALNIVKNINVENQLDTLPAIINNFGQVVYSTNSMARILKHIDGEIYGWFNINTNLYSDANLTNLNGYINQGYVDDAPIIEDRGSSALIQVGGLKAWINNDTNTGNNEIIIVPLNQVTNPSYYYVSNGVLKHFITSNIKADYEYGTDITVGKAPGYLKAGVKYYSYDEMYFYTDLNQLISDLKGNNNNNSVNGGNPYYNYYKNLSFRSTSTYTADKINSYINSNTIVNSKLRGIGQALIKAQNEYGVNALLMLGIAINESNWGKSPISQEKNNIFGLDAVDSNPGLEADAYSTVEDCINDFAKNYISRAYADPQNWTYYGAHLGNKVSGANVKYASDPFWGEKAAQHAFDIDNGLGGIDQDLYQLSIVTSAKDVIGEKGEYLYTINAGVPVTLNKDSKVDAYYQLNPDRTTPKSSGRFKGSYDWSYRGKVTSSNIRFINTRKNETQLSKGISYQTHVENYGWQDWKNNGEMSGTSGEAKRLEGIKIILDNTIQGARISYQTHVQDYGWQDWKKDGQMSGTSGESKRLEAIRIKLENAPGYKVEYRVHVQEYGWQEWKSDGEIAGTSGEAKRLEGIEIRIVKDISIEYRTHIEEYGWQEWKFDGEMAGTSGESKRLESIELKLTDFPEGANIVYQTHVQEYGWQGWKHNGELSGTTGESKRLEGIRIKLENAPGYKVEYRVHVQDYGWQEWKSDGEIAGTTGEAKRLEGIEVRIVKK